MSNTKEVHSKLHVSLSTCYLGYGRHVARLHRRRRAYAPTSNIASHDNHEKINLWVSFWFPYMGCLWGSAWRPFRPPELRYYTKEHTQAWCCSWITRAAFGVFRHDIGQLSFYLPFTTTTWPFFLKKHDRQNHTAIDKLIERYPLIPYNEFEICFANLFNAVVLLRLHFIIVYYFKLLFCKNASGGSGINSAYHTCRHDLTGQSDSSIVFRWNKTDQDRACVTKEIDHKLLGFLAD